MKLMYYYSKGCSCCKGYEQVVKAVCECFNLNMESLDIDRDKIDVKLQGVPTVTLIDDEGVERYRSVGNLKEEYLTKALEEMMRDEGGD